MIVLFWLLNAGISYLNAYCTGKAWVEAKAAGGWQRLMAWCGGIMSACGFSWCILILLAVAVNKCGYLNDHYTMVMLQLGYLMVVPFILVTGLLITLDSWAHAFRTRSVTSYGIATYNTFAQAYNTYHAVKDWGGAFEGVMDAFKPSSDDDDSKTAILMLVLFLVFLSLAGGTLLTVAIVRKYAATTPMVPWSEAQENRQLRQA